MRLRIMLTLETPGEGEAPVYAAYISATDSLSTRLGEAERAVRATLKFARIPAARIRKYVGPTVIEAVDIQD